MTADGRHTTCLNGTYTKRKRCHGEHGWFVLRTQTNWHSIEKNHDNLRLCETGDADCVSLRRIAHAPREDRKGTIVILM